MSTSMTNERTDRKTREHSLMPPPGNLACLRHKMALLIIMIQITAFNNSNNPIYKAPKALALEALAADQS